MTKRRLERELRDVLANPTANRSLGDILALKERERFMLAIQKYACPPGGMTGWSWDRLLTLPPEPRLILVLNAFTGALLSSGIGKFLIETRELFEEVLACCKTIGATRAVQYLEQVPACFQGKMLPASREECGDAMIVDDGDTATAKCLRQLDARYPDSYDQVIDSLHSYIVANRERFEAACASLSQ